MDNSNMNEVITAEFTSTSTAVALRSTVPAKLKPAPVALPQEKKQAKYPSRDGVTTYAPDNHVGQIRFKGFEKVSPNGKPYFSQKFTSFKEAKDWVRDETSRYKKLLKDREANGAAKGGAPLDMPLANVFDLYVDLYPERMPPLKNGKRATLPYHGAQYFVRLKEHPVLKSAKLRDVNVDLMRDYCEARLAAGAKPSTINSDFGYLGRAIKMVAR